MPFNVQRFTSNRTSRNYIIKYMMFYFLWIFKGQEVNPTQFSRNYSNLKITVVQINILPSFDALQKQSNNTERNWHGSCMQGVSTQYYEFVGCFYISPRIGYLSYLIPKLLVFVHWRAQKYLFTHFHYLWLVAFHKHHLWESGRCYNEFNSTNRIIM